MILLEADPSPVYALAFSPDGGRLAVGTRAGGVRFFNDLGGDDSLPEAPPLGTAVNSIAFSPAGAWVAVGGGMGWHAQTESGKRAGPLARPRTPPRPVTGVKFVTETLLAVGVGDRSRSGAGSLELWDVATNKPREPQHTAPEGVRAVAVCPARKRVAWAEWGRRVSVWDVESSAPTRFPLARSPATVGLSPDGDRVVAAADRVVHLFDVPTKRELVTLKGHIGVVTAAEFAPDGRAVATGSWDGTVRFWDPGTGAETAAYAWPVGRVCGLAFSPDGLRLAVGGDKGVVAVVDVD